MADEISKVVTSGCVVSVFGCKDPQPLIRAMGMAGHSVLAEPIYKTHTFLQFSEELRVITPDTLSAEHNLELQGFSFRAEPAQH